MNWAIVVAIISPLIYAASNILDKYVLSHRVKSPLGYAGIAGIVNICIALFLILLLDWNISHSVLIYPIITGILAGACLYFYFYLLKHTDASYIIGFIYLYPIIVALLSYLFLQEQLSFLSYAAIGIILLGIILLSIRAKQNKVGILIIPLAVYILLLGGYEFFVKVTTNNLSFIQGLAIDLLFCGITLVFGLLHPKVRYYFLKELKNFRWAIVGEGFTLLAAFSFFYATSKLPITIVATLGATQPLVVVLFERIAHARFGNITQDIRLVPKLGAIILIVVGVILLSILNS